MLDAHHAEMRRVARNAGLTYATDQKPGIQRRGRMRKWDYIDPKGKKFGTYPFWNAFGNSPFHPLISASG